MKFSMIVACDKNRGIGIKNDLPWDLPTDMKYFRTTTASPDWTGEKSNDRSRSLNAVIMGRKTWESLPIQVKPLPKRINIVLTRNPEYPTEFSGREDVIFAHSLDEALEFLEKFASELHEVFVIGGGNVYAHAIEHQDCNKLYITEIDRAYECDTFFPEVPSTFTEESRSKTHEENGVSFEFVIYKS